ncbi:hypothetical protein [Alienimonas chondri]|uniref:DUF3592 domain-containing protein n=1 Tax=Alienimonas chondri TaxID=2681879 RepID=A0ABX1VBW1_9PLAN|nr:hypothetical protein [Alienimonas chondri]NNJ25436.1 hypothetical protein [Alienimonas chondri]
MVAPLRTLLRAGGALSVLSLPAIVVLATLGAGFAAAPEIRFLHDDPLRLMSTGFDSDEHRTPVTVAVRRTFPEPLHRHSIWVRRTVPVEPSASDAGEGWGPAPWFAAYQSWEEARRLPDGTTEGPTRTTLATASVGGLLIWVAGLTALWLPWAWRTGRFARLEAPSFGRRAALGRALRPWVGGLAGLGALCLAGGPPEPRGDDRTVMAEVRRDDHVSLHPRALWVAWETEAPPHGGGAARTPFGGRDWGVTVERTATLWGFAGRSGRDQAIGRRRWTAAISLTWLAAAAGLWSAVSLWRSRRAGPDT